MVGGVLLARAVLHHATWHMARRIQRVEEDAGEAVGTLDAAQEEPDAVIQDHTQEGWKEMEDAINNLAEPAAARKLRRRRRDRFVAALVQIARAEMGTPFSRSFDDAKVREAHEIKVATFLRRYCKERHVRMHDIAMHVPAAVMMYFVPTEADVQMGLIGQSAIVQARRQEMAAASSSIAGRLQRFMLGVLGHELPGVGALGMVDTPDPAQRAGKY